MMFLVHVLGQHIINGKDVIAQVELKIQLGDKTIKFSVHMLSKKAFVSK